MTPRPPTCEKETSLLAIYICSLSWPESSPGSPGLGFRTWRDPATVDTLCGVVALEVFDVTSRRLRANSLGHLVDYKTVGRTSRPSPAKNTFTSLRFDSGISRGIEG